VVPDGIAGRFLTKTLAGDLDRLSEEGSSRRKAGTPAAMFASQATATPKPSIARQRGGELDAANGKDGDRTVDHGDG
jgi:hypothetical protein